MRFWASLLLGLAACGGDDEPSFTMTATPLTVARGGEITLTFNLKNFTLTGGHQHGLAPAHEDGTEHAEAATTKEGHVHVYLDTTDANPLLQAEESPVKLTITASTGAHKLIGRLHAGDHKIIEPQIISTVDITVTD